MSDRPSARLALILLLFAAVPLCVAQQPAEPGGQEPVKVYTEKVSRDVGAQYVVAYTPPKPFGREGGGERRRAEMSARRTGPRLFTLRSVVTAPQRATHEE